MAKGPPRVPHTHPGRHARLGAVASSRRLIDGPAFRTSFRGPPLLLVTLMGATLHGLATRFASTTGTLGRELRRIIA